MSYDDMSKRELMEEIVAFERRLVEAEKQRDKALRHLNWCWGSENCPCNELEGCAAKSIMTGNGLGNELCPSGRRG